MFSDIIKSFQSHITDRLTNPLTGSITVAWVLWNYRFIVVLFSDATILRTFKLIDTVIFPDIHTLIVRGVALPIVTAAFYIFVFPYPSKFVYRFTRMRQKELNEERQKIENEVLLSREESREIRVELATREIEYRKNIDRNEQEIAGLRDINKKMTAELTDTLNVKNNPQLHELTESQMSLMYAIREASGKLSENKLFNNQGEMTVNIQHDLDVLKDGEFVERIYDYDQSENIYAFTRKGRAAIVTWDNSKEDDQLSNGYKLSRK